MLRRCFLLLLLLTLPLLAEDEGEHHLAVLDPASGKLLGHYRLTRSIHLCIEQGTEDPHFQYLREFLLDRQGNPCKPKERDGGPYRRPDNLDTKAFMGQLPDGDSLIWFRTRTVRERDYGPLKRVTPDGIQKVLARDVNLMAPGWRPMFTPGLCTAGPYLLGVEKGGSSCRSLQDGSLIWRSSWEFGHCRWNLGAWYQGGAFYCDTKQGLSRVDADTGKLVWAWPDAVELLDVRLYPDNLLYVEYQYGLHSRLYQGLRKQAAARYGLPEDAFRLRVVPYRDTYFASMWFGGKAYLQDGRMSVWEFLNGKWSYVFDYPCAGQTEESLNALYATHRFSPVMRRHLTTDFTEP